MNIFIMGLFFINLAQIPSTNQQQIVPNAPACNKINKIVYDATNKECNIYAHDKKECFQKFENVLSALPVLGQIVPLQDDCKKELTVSHAQTIHDQLIEYRQQIDCKRENLDSSETYFCRQSKKDIKELKRTLRNQRSM